MGDCQNYGPFLGPYYNTGPNTGPNSGDPKRDHNFDNLPYICVCIWRGSARGESTVPVGAGPLRRSGSEKWPRRWNLDQGLGTKRV